MKTQALKDLLSNNNVIHFLFVTTDKLYGANHEYKFLVVNNNTISDITNQLSELTSKKLTKNNSLKIGDEFGFKSQLERLLGTNLTFVRVM